MKCSGGARSESSSEGSEIEREVKSEEGERYL
jgi:hypothetical protein